MAIYFNIRFILCICIECILFTIMGRIYPFYFLQPYWGIVSIPYSSFILIVQFGDFESIYLDVQPSPQSSFRTVSSFHRVPSCLLQLISVLFSCPRRWSAFFLCNFGFFRHFTYKWNHPKNSYKSSFLPWALCFLGLSLLHELLIYFFFWLLLYAHPFTSWWIFGLFTVWGYYDWCSSDHLHTNAYVFIPLG